MSNDTNATTQRLTGEWSPEDRVRRSSPDASVLIAEDNEHTARFIEMGFDVIDADIATQVVPEGRTCLAHLGQAAGDPVQPDLVLLDLDLPLMDGLTVLEHRDTDPPLRRIPVIVLSGTDDQRTVDRCYAAGATAFIAKPDELDGFFAIAELVAEFLLSAEDSPETDSDDDPLESVRLKPPSGTDEPSSLSQLSSPGRHERSDTATRFRAPPLNFLRLEVPAPTLGI